VSTVQKQDLRTFVHRGISKRHFTKEFKLADDVNIQSVGMSDGMLNINLLKVIPEDKKRKVLNID
jgi:molecular chaperone IbpA